MCAIYNRIHTSMESQLIFHPENCWSKVGCPSFFWGPTYDCNCTPKYKVGPP